MNKKLIGILLVLLVFLIATGCGQKNEDSTVVTTDATTESAETKEPLIPGVAENLISPEDFENAIEENKKNTEDEMGNSATTKSEEAPQPTEPKPTEPKPTEPKPTEPKPTEPKPTEPKPTEPKPTTGKSEYQKYLDMSGAEQQAFVESFNSLEDFFTWLNAAKAEDEAQKNVIVTKDGVIDLGDLAG